MIILSAALDLVGPSIPKSLVLLFDVVPSFFTKLIAPYFIHRVSYESRIIFFVALSVSGMLLIALTRQSTDSGTVWLKMVGVMLASLSSGGGELSFLGLTHFYGHFSLAAWGSGTGGAGLIGAGAYVVATTWFKLSVRTTLIAFSFLPLFMLLSFFAVLPRGSLKQGRVNEAGYEAIISPEEEERLTPEDVDDDPTVTEYEGVLSNTAPPEAASSRVQSQQKSGIRENLQRAKALFFP